ncbi:MAG TPA: response regulator [Pyrinomonadaceae bacterium]|nr:response regulator [Pyrinomonadaceae bacterium]
MTDDNESTRKRILCVEDDRDTCEVLRFVMTDYEFTAVHSVAQAQPFIDSGEFDLYVLDNWLPDGSGIELCEHIRNSGVRAPILFTSAIGRRQDIDVAIEAGADRYLVKPYEPEMLVRTIKELLNVETLAFES